MACRFEVTLSGEHASQMAAAREALDAVDGLENTLSVFRDASEVSEVNRRAADQPVPVGDSLFALLQHSQELHADTEGAFDPTATPLSRCWGFHFREGRLPDATAIAEALGRVGYGDVILDPRPRSVRFGRRGLELSFGSIGKGYALDEAVALLRARGVPRALVSAGGSSFRASGGGPGYVIDVGSRRAPDAPLFRLRLRDAALATSGAGEQFFETDGRRYGHVLDPRTGWPAQGVLSASVVARSAAAADALSTALLIGGPGLAERYCARHDATLALLTMENDRRRLLRFGSHDGAAVEEGVHP